MHMLRNRSPGDDLNNCKQKLASNTRPRAWENLVWGRRQTASLSFAHHGACILHGNLVLFNGVQKAWSDLGPFSSCESKIISWLQREPEKNWERSKVGRTIVWEIGDASAYYNLSALMNMVGLKENTFFIKKPKSNGFTVRNFTTAKVSLNCMYSNEICHTFWDKEKKL